MSNKFKFHLPEEYPELLRDFKYRDTNKPIFYFLNAEKRDKKVIDFNWTKDVWSWKNDNFRRYLGKRHAQQIHIEQKLLEGEKCKSQGELVDMNFKKKIGRYCIVEAVNNEHPYALEIVENGELIVIGNFRTQDMAERAAMTYAAHDSTLNNVEMCWG